MKKYICLSLILLFSLGLSAKNDLKSIYTKSCNDKALVKTAKKWVKSGAWRNGFFASSPHKTVNAVEFYSQFQKNKQEWNAAFSWLAKNDLLNMPKGNYKIEVTNLIASVQDDFNEALDKHQSESHYHHVDLQYTVSGIEGFGIIEHETSKPSCKYKPDVIHYFYNADKARFYNSSVSKFFLFFPEDWHIAKVITNKKNQKFRVIVIKLNYVE